MTIHIVAAGETLSGIAARYGVAYGLLARWNGLAPPYRLAVGQSLLVLFPRETYVTRPGDTLFSISGRTGVSLRRIWQLNPNLGGAVRIYPGQTLVLSLADEPALGAIETFGYAYPNVNLQTLRGILPYATDLMPFTYGITESGGLVALEDETLIRLAKSYNVRPFLHLSTLTEGGGFSSERAQRILQSGQLQQTLADAVLRQIETRGYEGLDIDFEFIYPEYAAAYAGFVALLRERVAALGYETYVALAPKTSADQPGVIYEGHDYALLGAAADAALVMTYEWGYTYSPPMAVAPLPSVRAVLDFAVGEIPPEKLFLGFPNYGYDWTLPYVSGESRARVVGNEQAVQLAVRYGARIDYDARAATPHFSYVGEDGRTHEVWFEDVRSSEAKLRLVAEYGLRGVGYWNFMRPFTAQFVLLSARYALQP